MKYLIRVVVENGAGKDTFTTFWAGEARIKKQKADIVVVEGVRWMTDVPMLGYGFKPHEKPYLVEIYNKNEVLIFKVKE